MPSLNVIKITDCDYTYHYFHGYLVEFDDNTPKSKSLLASFVKCILVAVLCHCTVYVTFAIFWYYLRFNFASIFDQYELYYGTVIVVILFQFIFSCLIIIFFFNQGSQNSIKLIVLISFLINVVLDGSLLLLLSSQYHKDILSNIIAPQIRFFCQFEYIQLSDKKCETKFSYYVLYLFTFYQPFSLLIMIVVNHLCRFKCKLCNMNINHSNDVTSTSISINTPAANDIELALLGSKKSNNNDDSNHVHQFEGYDTYYYKYGKYSMLCLFVIFGVTWMFLVFSINVVYYLIYDYDLTYFFYGLLALTAIFKIILKALSKQIDVITMQKNTIVNFGNFKNRMSLELLMEFVVNLMYFHFYYYGFIVKLSLVDNIWMFIFITGLHVLSEVCQSVVRFSKQYFDLTTKLFAKLINTCTDGCCNCNADCCVKSKCNQNCNSGFEKYLRDDSTFDEWRTRHSIDMSLRVISLIISFVNVTITLFAVGYKNFEIQTKNEFYRALLYFIVSFSVDMIYFGLVFSINLYKLQFNVWKPLLTMFSGEKKIITCFFIVASGFFFF